MCYCPPQKVIPIKGVSVIHSGGANIYGAVLKTRRLKATRATLNLESPDYFGCARPFV